MSKGSDFIARSKKVIPGGSMLLSKKPERFLKSGWPGYFSRTSGCHVWDLDNKKYLDMSIMGIGTNLLGYSHPEVDASVMNVINTGNMSTFNAPEEVLLAERLIEINPWADMVRFARSGGEINSIAIRLARAATGRDKIAICGYHGWHDWYLSANLKDRSNLNQHIIAGLNPLGVPANLTGNTIPFIYNDIDSLKRILSENDIAAIKMEVFRYSEPDAGFLAEVRSLADQYGCVLIFDECTSGFRETFGGLHKKYNVEPDVAVFAKALGNGYAVSACVGVESVMSAASRSFISSTFWTERIGSAAALKALEVMEREESWKAVTHLGLLVNEGWRSLAKDVGLDVDVKGLPALTTIDFKSPNNLAYKTLVTQESLKKGILASNCVYLCTSHSEALIARYLEVLEPIFKTIARCEDGDDVNKYLDSGVCESGFGRLN